MQLNKKLSSVYVFLCVTLIAILIVGLYFYGSQPKESYTLKEYGGKIAVFIDEKTEPEQVLDIQVSIFPDTDRELLKDGITVNSSEELYRLIEDFSG